MSDLPTKPTSQTPGESDYRHQLVILEQQSQTNFDKTLLTLAGGALGVSFAFVKDFLGGRPPTLAVLLLVAWLCWVLSLASAASLVRIMGRDVRTPLGTSRDGQAS